MTTRLAVLLAILTVAGCEGKGSVSLNVSSSAASPRPSPSAPIMFPSVFNEFENEAAGDVSYKGKWVTFDAYVKTVDKRDDGSYVVKILNFTNMPHAGEVAFSSTMAADVAKLKAFGNVAPAYTFQAFCTGRKPDYQKRNEFNSSSKYIVTFEDGAVIGEAKPRPGSKN